MKRSQVSNYIRLPQNTFNLDEITVHSISDVNIQLIRKWRNMQMGVLRQSLPITESEQIAYFENYVFTEYSKLEPKQILFEIYNEASIVGYGGLVHCDWTVPKAELSFLLSPEIQEGGVVYLRIFDRFIKLMEDIAFNKLEILRLFTETYSFREQHINVLEQNKFTREGTLRDHIIHDGKLSDSIFHGKLRTDHFV